MKRVRIAFFWVHLAAGLTAGLVILVLSITGAALAFKPQIIRAIETAGFDIQSQGRRPLEPSALIAAFREVRPASDVRSVTVSRDESSAASIQSAAGSAYLDPYTGHVLGESSTRTEQVFRSIENWHRWLAMQGDARQAGRAVVGIANVTFLFLSVSGLYLWWPRSWTLTHLRPIVWFRRTSTGRARDFNWHHVAGLWSAPMIIVMAVTGTLMSYPALNARLQQAAGGASGGESGGERRGPERGPAGGERRPNRPEGRGAREAGPSVKVDDSVVDKAATETKSREVAWSSVTIELPRSSAAPVTAVASTGQSTPAGRSRLSIDATSGEVVQWAPASDAGTAQTLRAWVRFGHTGEQWGVAGQTLAAVSCLGGVLLVWSGLALAVRRALGAFARTRHARKTVAVPMGSQA